MHLCRWQLCGRWLSKHLYSFFRLFNYFPPYRFRRLWFLLLKTFFLLLLFLSEVDAVLTEPFIKLQDLVLRHREEVFRALRMEPSTIDALFLGLTFDEVSGQ